MAEAADKTESERFAHTTDDDINVKKYLQTTIEEWDRCCGKFPPKDDLFMRGYLERQFCQWNLFRGYDFDSIKMRPFPEFDSDGKIDLDIANKKISFRYVIGFSRPCDTYDMQFLLHCINFAVQKGSIEFPAAKHTRVHINGATHGDETGGYVHVRATGKTVNFYKEGAWAFARADQRLLDNIDIKGSFHQCTAYEPALYPLARFIINSWSYSADGFYGGLHIPWGCVAMLFGDAPVHAHMDKKFKELRPKIDLRSKNRDGEPGEDTIGKQPFSEMFARFERKQSTITSDDLEKHLEKFQLNDAQTHASNVEIYHPSICRDAVKKVKHDTQKEDR